MAPAYTSSPWAEGEEGVGKRRPSLSYLAFGRRSHRPAASLATPRSTPTCLAFPPCRLPPRKRLPRRAPAPSRPGPAAREGKARPCQQRGAPGGGGSLRPISRARPANSRSDRQRVGAAGWRVAETPERCRTRRHPGGSVKTSLRK